MESMRTILRRFGAHGAAVNAASASADARRADQVADSLSARLGEAPPGEASQQRTPAA
ncbi:MAG: hypothetical protein H0U89_06200 [Acidimicrobiia bacterium]|nr:hypothetical protein [Acidimicrobiia bacterium]